MSRHAYLIICHNNWNQLRFLIENLSDSRNDFYILVDSKATDFDQHLFMETCSCKRLYFVEPIDICWGDYSLVEAELSLLKASTSNGHYSYYHLLSGADMPLVSQNTIHDFFDKNNGCEFVDFDLNQDYPLTLKRLKYYYFFQDKVGRKRINFYKILRDLILLGEKAISVNRTKDIEKYLAKGSNWFSITDDFARYILANEDFIATQFRNSYCCDEHVIQTLLNMSPYKKNWYGYKNTSIMYQNLRYLDWGRGKPYTFKKGEFFELSNGDHLFARKFSSDIISTDVKQHLLSV